MQGSLRHQLGRTVRDLRQAKGLSQERLADEAGIHRSFLYRLERGDVNVSVDTLQRIAQALGVPISQILASAELNAS